MKQLLISLLLILNISCSDEDIAATGIILASFTLLYSMNSQQTKYYHGEFYYKTESCDAQYRYFELNGTEHYSVDCHSNAYGDWVSFGYLFGYTTVYLYKRK